MKKITWEEFKDLYCDKCKRHISKYEDNHWVHSVKCVCISCMYSSQQVEEYRYEQSLFYDDIKPEE